MIREQCHPTCVDRAQDDCRHGRGGSVGEGLWARRSPVAIVLVASPCANAYSSRLSKPSNIAGGVWDKEERSMRVLKDSGARPVRQSPMNPADNKRGVFEQEEASSTAIPSYSTIFLQTYRSSIRPSKAPNPQSASWHSLPRVALSSLCRQIDVAVLSRDGLAGASHNWSKRGSRLRFLNTSRPASLSTLPTTLPQPFIDLSLLRRVFLYHRETP